MTLTHLKMAWRHLQKDRSFTLVNLFGLAIGLAAAMAVILYVQDELSYEAFHERSDRITRAQLHAEFDGQPFRLDAAPNAVAPWLARDIPEVEEAVRVFAHNFGEPASVRVGTTNFVEPVFYWADGNLLDVFTLELRSGMPVEALRDE